MIKDKETKKNMTLKYDKAKIDFSLLPFAPLRQIASVLMHGAKKYGRDNWKKGLEYSRLFSACQRHLIAWWEDYEDIDQDSGLPHLAHAICNLLFLLEGELKNKGIDNRSRIIIDTGKNGKPKIKIKQYENTNRKTS